MVVSSCYCGSGLAFQTCCQALLLGKQKATTAEALMRSRYAAYATQNVDYLIATTHSSQRKYYSKDEMLFWASSNQWQRLEIRSVTPTTVDFKAYFIDAHNQLQVYHEHSRFAIENNEWMYVDGDYFE